MNKPHASLLLTGDELVNGDIVETNSVKISKDLTELGIEIQQKRLVGDQLERIVNAILELSSSSHILIVNGGLGSTIDDLGAEAASKAADRPLLEHKEAKNHIDKIYQKTGKTPDDLRYRQALIPKGAEILPNSIGTAVGFKLIINHCHCYFMPGVPREMDVMLSKSVIPDISKNFPVKKLLDPRRLFIFGLGELEIQRKIYEHFPQDLWETIKLGFRVSSPFTEIKLSCDNSGELTTLREAVKGLQELFPTYGFSQGKTMSETLIELLQSRQETIAFAESCTGGMIAANITAIPGASMVFQAAIVSYSNRAKEQILGVPGGLIQDHGAVSSEVVKSMVTNIINKSQSDYGIGVTGIAGPSGGTEEKAVGTVYIGFGNKKEFRIRKLIIKRERILFQKYVTATALDLIRRFILELPTDIPYNFDKSE